MRFTERITAMFTERGPLAREIILSFPEDPCSKRPGGDLNAIIFPHCLPLGKNEGKINVNTGVTGSSPRAMSPSNKHIRSQVFDPVNTWKLGNEEKFLCPFCQLREQFGSFVFANRLRSPS